MIPVYVVDDAGSAHSIARAALSGNGKFNYANDGSLPRIDSPDDYEKAAHFLEAELSGPSAVILDVNLGASAWLRERIEAFRARLSYELVDWLARSLPDQQWSGIILAGIALGNRNWRGVLTVATSTGQPTNVIRILEDFMRQTGNVRRDVYLIGAADGLASPDENSARAVVSRTLSEYESRFAGVAENLLRDLIRIRFSPGAEPHDPGWAHAADMDHATARLLEGFAGADREVLSALFDPPADGGAGETRHIPAAALGQIMQAAGIQVGRISMSLMVQLPVAPGAIFVFSLLEFMRRLGPKKVSVRTETGKALMTILTPLYQELDDELTKSAEGDSDLTRAFRSLLLGGFDSVLEALAAEPGICDAAGVPLQTVSGAVEEWKAAHQGSPAVRRLAGHGVMELRWNSRPHQGHRGRQEDKPLRRVSRLAAGRGGAQDFFAELTFFGIRGRAEVDVRFAQFLCLMADRRRHPFVERMEATPEELAKIGRALGRAVTKEELDEQMSGVPRHILSYAEVCLILCHEFERRAPTLSELAHQYVDGIRRRSRERTSLQFEPDSLFENDAGHGYHLSAKVKLRKESVFLMPGMNDVEEADRKLEYARTGQRPRRSRKVDY